MNYEEAAAYLLDIPKFAGKTSHDNLRGFLVRLGNPQNDIKAIHIAGTNGKGSTCAFLASILQQAGYHVGMFTSPHLIKINERFQLNNDMITDEEFVEVFQSVKQAVDEGIRDGLVHPNFFEYIFIMAACWYRKKNQIERVDYVIYETGLGGRLDATNVLHPCLTIITSIGLDHMQYLGNTVAKIAGEKAGIMKAGIPCIYLTEPAEACEVIEKQGKKLDIPMIPVEKLRISIQKSDKDWIDFQYISHYDKKYGQINGIYRIRGAALYQLENAALALEAAGYLLDGQKQAVFYMRQGLLTMYWRGRMEEVYPDFFVDGAHNEPAIRAFCNTLVRMYQDKKIILLFAVSSDKSYNEMIQILCGQISYKMIIVTAIEGQRTTPADSVADIFETYIDCPVVQKENLHMAYEYAKQQLDGSTRVFCVGSLYLVGSLLEDLEKRSS